MAMEASMMALHFKVTPKAYITPSWLTLSGPKENNFSPGKVKGRKIHKKSTKEFTSANLVNTFLGLKCAVRIATAERDRATIKVDHLPNTAVITQKHTPEAILILGSRRWIKESPIENSSICT